jgi:hypothetical protein
MFHSCRTQIISLITIALIGTGTGLGRAQTSPKPKPRPRTNGPEITVRSSAAAESAGAPRPSDFLRPPSTGTSRYEPGSIDWRDVPPWRQTSFFGVRAQGQFFVYVVDCSGSMLDDDRLIRAKRELSQSVSSLQLPQRFQVIFYNDRPLPMLGALPRAADLTAKSQLNHWLRLIEPDGGTDPRAALALALAQRPDAVFLLSDGEFPEGTVAAVAAKNPRKVPIHCIDLSGGIAGDQLGQIARESGGQYASRPPRADEVSP